ncbi:MAG: MBL fold metallo-hydrolase [Alicyclobacillus sp.]|nr:MBL fold metallo-hydrolase [Alicyclobacillus sp.]
MPVQAFVVSPLSSNCYVLSPRDVPGAPAVLVDPGDDALDPVFQYIEEHRFQVQAVWCTHAHLDHVLGVDVVRRRYHVPAWVHAADVPLWDSLPSAAGSWLQRTVPSLAPPDHFWQDGDQVSVGEWTFTVWHTPGHSPGSVCLVGEDVAFTGDTLFAGTIGRTDLPLSNAAEMQRSLRRLHTLDDALVLYPGHMGSTTIGRERRVNPFFRM